MKTSFFKHGVLIAVLTFSFGCGKKSNGGGGSSASTNTSTVTTPTTVGSIDAAGNLAPGILASSSLGILAIQNFNRLVAWNNSGSEGVLLGARKIGFSRGVTVGSATPNIPDGCSAIKIFGATIGYACSGSDTVSMSYSTEGTPSKICLGRNSNSELITATATSLTSTSCQASGSGTVYTKEGNTELKKVLTLDNGNWYLWNVSVSGSVYYVTVGAKSGFNLAPMTVYTIDTSIHSVYNPAQVEDLATQKKTRIYEVY